MALDFGGIIGMFIPMIVVQLQKAMDEGLDNIAVKNPKLHKVIVVVSHIALKEYGEQIVADTTNTFDDAGVAAAVKTLQDNAIEHGITLAA